jgi:hypothetical protein
MRIGKCRCIEVGGEEHVELFDTHNFKGFLLRLHANARSSD